MNMLKPAALCLLALILAGLTPLAALAQSGTAPRVVADIAPVHSLAARVMEGVAEPDLLLRAGTSPHDYSMKPSEARMLDRADIVVWTGQELTPWLADALSVLAPEAEQIVVSGLDGISLLEFRTGARFESHDHAAEENETEKDGADDHGSEQGIDPHLWLDPRNAAVLVAELARVLSERDPVNAGRYRANAERTLGDLSQLEAGIDATLAPLRGRSFLVFHDAYHYFEARFDIPASGAVALSDGVRPSAQRIRELQQLIADRDVVCVFAEPQFEPKLLYRLAEGTAIRTGVLDPVGAGIAPGPDHYQALLQAMADGLADCLAP